MRSFLPSCSFLCFSMIACPTNAQEAYVQLSGAVHIHTDFSTGRESIADVADRAIEQGIDVLIITDDDLLQVGYGPPFLRNLLQFSREEPAVLSNRGLQAYLDEIARVDELHPNLMLIDGIESAPFYYWDVDLAEMRWTLRSWNKHMTAIDLRTADAYEGLPIMGGEHIGVWHWAGLLHFWPLAGIVYAFVAGSTSHTSGSFRDSRFICPMRAGEPFGERAKHGCLQWRSGACALPTVHRLCRRERRDGLLGAS